MILPAGTADSAFRMKISELAQLAPALVDGRIVLVRFFVQVPPAHEAKPLAVGPAERRQRRGEDELFAKEWSEVDPEVASDPLGVRRRRVPRIAAHDIDG